MSLKTTKSVKQLAQLRSKQLGIPLGTLINAFMRNLGQTGEVSFSIGDQMTPQMADKIRQMRQEISDGKTSGPFSIEEAEHFLDSIPQANEN